jgi:hypothetical protein
MSKKIEVRLSDELSRELDDYCSSNNVPVSKVVREGIILVIRGKSEIPSPTVEKTKAPEVVVTPRDPRSDIRKTEDAWAKVMRARKHGY